MTFSPPPEKAGAWLHDHLDLPTLPVDPRYKKPAPPLGTFSGVPLNDLTLGKGAGGDGYGALSGGGGPMGSSSDGYGALSGAKTSSGWFSGGLPGPVVPRDVGSDKGLTPTSQSVKKVVSSLFPQINDIGGWRPPDGYNEHSSGQALDVMIPNANSPQGKALGDQITQYVLAHAKELGVDYAMWQHGQHNPDGSFQYYKDRGGPTQNHMTTSTSTRCVVVDQVAPATYSPAAAVVAFLTAPAVVALLTAPAGEARPVSAAVAARLGHPTTPYSWRSPAVVVAPGRWIRRRLIRRLVRWWRRCRRRSDAELPQRRHAARRARRERVPHLRRRVESDGLRRRQNRHRTTQKLRPHARRPRWWSE